MQKNESSYNEMLFHRHFQLGLAYTLVKDYDSAIQVCVCMYVLCVVRVNLLHCIYYLLLLVFATLKAYQKAKNTLKGTIGKMSLCT